MDQQKKGKNTYRQFVVPAVILVAFLIYSLVSYGVGMLREAKTEVLDNYESKVQSISAGYEKEIYSVVKVAEVIADELSRDEDLFSDTNKYIIKSVVGNLTVKKAFIVKPDYTAVDTKGNEYASISALKDYVDAMSGKSSDSDFILNESGEYVMLISKPILSSGGVVGYVILEYSPQILEQIVSKPEYPQINTYALISSDGTVIESAGRSMDAFSKNKNILNHGGAFSFSGNSVIRSFEKAIKDQRSGYSEVQVGTNGGYYLVYEPVGKYKAVSLMVVSAAQVNSNFAEESTDVRRLMIKIGLAICVFIAMIIAVASFNKARYTNESKELKDKADMDQLTELTNKAATERLIKEYLSGEGADKRSMVMLIDIDNFKKINDTMGHAFGDEVLSSFGHQIRSWFRVNDVLGRIGGDEFMILLKNVKEDNVRKEGERITQFFKNFTVGEYTKYSPTASIGVSVFPEDGKDFDSLYKTADRALYKSKRTGKNRLTFYADLDKKEQEEAPDKTGRD